MALSLSLSPSLPLSQQTKNPDTHTMTQTIIGDGDEADAMFDDAQQVCRRVRGEQGQNSLCRHELGVVQHFVEGRSRLQIEGGRCGERGHKKEKRGQERETENGGVLYVHVNMHAYT